MKKIIALVLTLALCMSLCACMSYDAGGNETSAENMEEPTDRFRWVEFVDFASDLWLGGYGGLFVDMETGVLYVGFKQNTYGWGFTVLLNADGTPMIWEEWEK